MLVWCLRRRTSGGREYVYCRLLKLIRRGVIRIRAGWIMYQGIGDKVLLQLAKAYLIGSLAVIRDLNPPVFQQIIKLTRNSNFAFKDHVQRQRIAIYADYFDCSNLFAISWLQETTPTVIFCPRNDLLRRYKAYYEPYLIKVIDILWLDTVLIDNALYSRKLLSQRFRVFVQGTLVVVTHREACTKLIAPLNKG